MFAALIAGAALASLLVLFARRGRPGSRRVYAVGLVVAALLYVLFAILGNAPALWIGIELLGLVLFGFAAYMGVRAPSLLILGWIAHVAWDVVLHVGAEGADYTPAWYPWLCVSFDLAIACAVLWTVARRGPAQDRT